MKKVICAMLMALGLTTAMAADFGKPVTWDRHSLMIDGHRVCPVMGEIHYSRVPASEWEQEVRKMKAGGVTIIATYVFWNHIEEEEGVFRWDGQRSLRQFLEVCKQQAMPVVLRLGPFCHGEVRNGGIPDWAFSKGCRLREQNNVFLGMAEKLYRQIFTQVQGLQWKDGGPVMAAQFDNEYRGRGEYLMALKKIAIGVGFDLPFYTRTGWPELRTPVPFGEMLPLYGDYADGFWDKETTEGCGNYYKAFNFKGFRSSTAIGTDLLGKQDEKINKGDEEYPYFTCELGGGMATAYHRRPFVYPEDAYSMALVKLGSGSNLLGYYMYHGGTNPEGRLNALNECQTSLGTANNDLPLCTYDFQASLGEFGQTYPQYYMLRPLHLFMQDWGEQLALMEASFPAKQDLKRGEDTGLRWAVRSTGESAFIFVNNYERFQSLSVKKNVQLSACGVSLPRLTIPSGAMAIFPVNVDGIRYATGQLVAKRNGKIYMMQIPGIPTTICLQDGKTFKNLKPKGAQKTVCKNICLLTKEEAERLFIACSPSVISSSQIPCTLVKKAGTLRTIHKGRAKVAEAPSETDWEQAAVYKITLTSHLSPLTSQLLSISYYGDCARLYAGGKLIADNFQYGRPFLYGLWRLPKDCTELELRILPMQKDAPVYLPREADKTQGEGVKNVSIITVDEVLAADSSDHDFVKGADVGFLAGQEQRGIKFHDRQGQERECLELLKNDYQMGAIRLRVWVNPRGGECDKHALLAMARRVKALGLDLMVDFHYSDSWADPGKQPIPEAWTGHTFEQMKQDLRSHTIEVLKLLQENNIQPRWVQVGNETSNGLLWPMGHIEKNPQQYAGFIRAGYDAVKEVFPGAIVIVHLDRGHQQALYDYNLDTVLKYGGKFDMVGMSLYPYWAMENHPELKADDIITDCIANIRHVSKKYNCDVMIVETGYEVDEQHPEKMDEGRRQLTRVIREARSKTGGRCRGVFYWEPQCLPGGYKLGAFDHNAVPTAIMEGFVE